MNVMKKYSIFLILVLFCLFLNSCKYDFVLPVEVPEVNPGGYPVSFSTQIQPILTDKCILCHSTQAPMMGSGVAYTQLVPKYVNTASPASSKFYTIPTSGTHGATVSATQGALILQWITEGAKNN
jgi:hypothetical protein